ncbi:MAG: DUF805 domain-containing protein [Paracoccus sp. (in: a-proteobacteria)]|nr:DUF805 domain-containing protein [Paracoccus sp. (in: a-proteobacteria)]
MSEQPPPPPRNRIGGPAWQGPGRGNGDSRPAAPPPGANSAASSPVSGPEVPGFVTSVRWTLSQYLTFSGRSRRAEYWWFILFLNLSGLTAAVLENPLTNARFGEGPLSLILSLVVLLPSITVTVRRFHDVDRSGWWLLAPVALFPVAMISMSVGLVLAGVLFLVFFVWTVMPSQSGTNRFGPSPLEP